MTINDIPNIEHCTVDPFVSSTSGTLLGYEVTAHEGWYVHFNDDVEDTANIYSVYVLLPVTYDFSIVEIVPASELPEDAVINNNDEEQEVM